jgi:hypothetical protein
MPPAIIGNLKHWRVRAAKMRELAVKMAGSHAAILLSDLAVHYDELADQAALKGQTGSDARAVSISAGADRP